jgi:hypothetical protein
MKKEKPPVGGSGDSTRREYHTQSQKSTDLEQVIRCHFDRIHDNDGTTQERQLAEIDLGTLILLNFSPRRLT